MEGAAKLPRSLKLIYGFGFAAEGVKNNSFLVLLLFFYQQIMGLDARLCGLAMMIALLVDAVVDPLIGIWSDSTCSRLGRRHPFLYASSLPFGLFFYAVFSPPAGLSETALFAWLLCTAVGTRCSMSLFDIPHQSLGAELTSDYDDRAMLQTLRSVFAWLSGLFNAWLIYHIFLPDSESYPQGLMNPAGYPKLAIWGACAVFSMTLLSALATQRAALRAQPGLARIPSQSLREIWEAVKSAFGNRSFRSALIAGVVLMTAFGITELLVPFLSTSFWKLNSAQLEILLLAIILSTLAASPVTSWLLTRYDKRTIAVLGCMTFVILRCGAIMARYLDILPGGEDPLLMRVIVVTCFFEYTALIIAMAMIGAMIADVTDEHELRTGRRQEGLLFAANAFAIQACVGLGSLISGFVIAASGLEAGQAAAGVAGEAARRLGMLTMGMIILLYSTAAFFFSRYGITRERHADVRARLEAAAAAEAL